jgi:hypothetical protein
LLIASVDEVICFKAFVRVPTWIHRRPRWASAAQSLRVITGDTLGRGCFPDHGITAFHRSNIHQRLQNSSYKDSLLHLLNPQ